MTETSSTPKADPVADVTMDEVTESLTGYDEIAIEEHMKLTFVELAAGKHSMKWARAHVALYLVRKGEKNAVAWKTAMSMPQKELQTFFPPPGDPNDITDEDAGKDEGTPAPSPTRRQRSASSPE